MKVRPILMNTDMALATWEGRKTQTRRIIKSSMFDLQLWSANQNSNNPKIKNICPYGKVGDLLYVRESFTEEACATSICYKADFPIIWPKEQTDGEEIIQIESNYRFKPSIHMPRWASRTTLEIIDIRIERLLDISHDDCVAEGCEGSEIFYYSPFDEFFALWESINGKDSLEANPWVWVVEFKVYKCNVDDFISKAQPQQKD